MIKIKSVLTAIGNPEIHKELKKNNINVIANDIQYKEGILEYLNESIDINYLVIDDELPGQIKTNELIKNIEEKNKRIKIILITKEDEKEVKAYKKIKEINIFELVSIINEGVSYINQHISLETIQERDGKIITILGPNGVGKSIFSVMFARSITNKKVLIIDLDIINNNIPLLLGVKNYSKKIKQIKNKTLRAEEIKKIQNYKNIKKNNIVEYDFKNEHNKETDILEYVIQTKYKIDLLSEENLMIYLYKKYNKPVTLENIKDIKKQYDIIIIDTSNNYILEDKREITNISDKIIFISGANVLEIKKSKELLNICEKSWKINKEKINIIFNKYTKHSVDKEILKNIFKDYYILGELELKEYYDKIINENNIKIKEIQKELDIIRRKIEKERRNIIGIK